MRRQGVFAGMPSWGCRKGIALRAEFGENVNRRNWWSLLGGHRNWAIWEISFGRRTDLPPNSKAQERRQKYVRQEYGLLARSFCRASFCLHSEARAVAPRLAGGAQQGTLPRATLGEIRLSGFGAWVPKNKCVYGPSGARADKGPPRTRKSGILGRAIKLAASRGLDMSALKQRT
jgi:hypothetical protein